MTEEDTARMAPEHIAQDRSLRVMPSSVTDSLALTSILITVLTVH